MRELVRSWGESLGYLKPSSLKQWGLVTLKKSVAAYVTLGVNFWVLLIVVGAFRLFLLPVFGVIGALSGAWLFFLIAWVVVTVLAVRPSLEKKDFFYFVKYCGHFFVALGMVIFFSLVMTLGDWWLSSQWNQYKVTQFLPYYDPNSMLSQIKLYLLSQSYYTVLFFFYMPIIFMLFFLFDNSLSVKSVFKSIWWGIKLLVYMLPLCLLISVGAQSIIGVVSWVPSQIQLLPVECETLFFCLLLPFYFSFLIYIYITQVHSHPEKY